MEKVKENVILIRNIIFEVISNLRIRSRFVKFKLNFEKILGINRFDDYQEIFSLCVIKGEEMEI